MSNKKPMYFYYVMFFARDDGWYIDNSHFSDWCCIRQELIEEIEDTIWEDDAILNIIYMWETNA